MKKNKLYKVKVLDLRYEKSFYQINLRYLFYDVFAPHRKEAVEIAREYYMRGEKEASSIELPFSLNLFTVDNQNLF